MSVGERTKAGNFNTDLESYSTGVSNTAKLVPVPLMDIIQKSGIHLDLFTSVGVTSILFSVIVVVVLTAVVVVVGPAMVVVVVGLTVVVVIGPTVVVVIGRTVVVVLGPDVVVVVGPIEVVVVVDPMHSTVTVAVFDAM